MNLIIVDGYNLIHGVPKLRRFLEHSLERARNELLDLLASYLTVRKVKIIVVFDGQAAQGEAPTLRKRNLHVMFSESAGRADAAIKRLLARQSNPKSASVVSDDSDLIRFARANQAGVLSSKEFYALLTKRRRNVKKNGIYDKFDGEMSEEELAEWMELFGIPQKKS